MRTRTLGAAACLILSACVSDGGMHRRAVAGRTGPGSDAAQQEPAQQEPSDNDLHTAYCVPVVKGQIALTQKGISVAQTPELQQTLAKLQVTLNREQSYLIPKLNTLDPVPINASVKRGETDWRDFMAMNDRCGAKCGAQVNKEQQACAAACGDSALIDRVKACADPTWLPF